MNDVDISGNLPPRLIVFDGLCNLCDSSVQFVIAHDSGAQFTFTPLQSETGQAILAHCGLPAVNFDSFIYIRNGKLYQRSTAALYVLRDIGGLWKAFFIFIIIPPFIRNLVYDLVAKYRYRWFGKKDSCMVPTPELRKRFI